METKREKIKRLEGAISSLQGQNDLFSAMLVEGLQHSCNSLEMLDNGDKEGFIRLMKEKYKGGLSDELFDNQELLDYFVKEEGIGSGYFAQEKFRNTEIDRYLETKLREHGLSNDEIAIFLVSRVAKQEFREYNDDEESAKEAERDEGYDGPKFKGTIQEKKDLIDNRIDNICTETKKMI